MVNLKYIAKIDYLLHYATLDALISSLPQPDIKGLAIKEQVIVLARFMSNSGQFFAEDANLDNQKRNLAIRTFIEFSIDEIREYGKIWLDKHREKNGTHPWFKEWEAIIKFATNDEIAKIYLSSDDDSTRKRISRPTGLLPFETSLEVRRKGLPI